jgi:hypothetical protein
VNRADLLDAPHPAGSPELRDAAMKFLARGDTAEVLRGRAADPRYAGRLAELTGITPAEAAGDLLEIAAAVDAVTAEGLTREQCYSRLGLAEHFGPYPGTCASAVAA